MNDKHVLEMLEREQTYYLSVESHYYELADAAGKNDAILFEMGQHCTVDESDSIDSVVTSNVEDARKFAEWLLVLCDEIERGA